MNVLPGHLTTDIKQRFALQGKSALLNLIICGSAHCGKNTLIERLLNASNILFENPLSPLEPESEDNRNDHAGSNLFVNGPASEREQGIINDVAYRYFSSEQRTFVAAVPSNDHDPRNMIIGASKAGLAVVMVDAREGVLSQTRRDTYLLSLLGIRHFVVAVNKMDLVDYAESTFMTIVQEFSEYANSVGASGITYIPISALKEDNITFHSDNMLWYQGASFMRHLETVGFDTERLQKAPFRMPVQWANSPTLDFSVFAGTIATGTVARGDHIRVQPSGKEGRIARIAGQRDDVERAVAGQFITITLDEQLHVAPGDLISEARAPAFVADQFESTLIWMHDNPMLPGRTYLMNIGAKTVTASVTTVKHQVDIDTLAHIAATCLTNSAIATCNISTDQPIPFDPYTENHETGSYILIDRLTRNVVGAGLLNFALRRSQNIHPQHVDVTKQARSAIKRQNPCVLWFTGLSGAGKSTIANLVEKKLHAMGHHTYLLDGDNVRHGLNKDLGFTAADRVENIRRIAEVAKMMVDAGLIVATAFISPFRLERQMARSRMANGEFIEIFVDTPLDVAEQRDRKGLYKKARRGELKNFTGIDSPYEPPEDPEFRMNTLQLTPEQAADKLIDYLRENGYLA